MIQTELTGNDRLEFKVNKNEPITYVIDDDILVTRSICGLLNSHGIQSSGYLSGLDFIREFRNDPRDCIVCDYKMPEMNGLEVHQKLKELGSQTPIIFLSGNADVKMTMTAWKDGAVTVIEKPFRADELIGAINQAFEFGNETWEKRRAQIRFQKVKSEELDVLRYLVKGLINKQIATRQEISERTVERRKSNLLDATETHSIIAAADLARKAGIDLRIE